MKRIKTKEELRQMPDVTERYGRFFKGKEMVTPKMLKNINFGHQICNYPPWAAVEYYRTEINNEKQLKNEFTQKINKIHKELIDFCTEKGIQASIHTSFQAGQIYILRSMKNQQIIKKNKLCERLN